MVFNVSLLQYRPFLAIMGRPHPVIETATGYEIDERYWSINPPTPVWLLHLSWKSHLQEAILFYLPAGDQTLQSI